MSTVTNNTTVARFAPPNNSMFWRFVWKEFRMIRSLCAAVAIMGLLIQCAERMLLATTTNFALTLLYTALAATVLYAVGAAATTFSVEHEEETYDLLTRLPITWWPPFTAKLLVTLVTSLLLAGLLSISAVALRGPHYLTENFIRHAFGMMGFAIFEAIAWGILFSLLIKRPLLAAIVTLVVGIVTVNVVVNYASRNSIASLAPEAYVNVLPFRLAIVVTVLACSTFAARRWLIVGAGPNKVSLLPANNRLLSSLTRNRSAARKAKAVANRVPRGRVLARLLWQTWRESWKLLLAPLIVAALLIAGIGAAIGLANQFNEIATFVMSAGLLFSPALYGAMTFYFDQRRGSYRFLAEHAARPRYTWLARHIVWLGAFLVVWLLFLTGIAVLAWYMQQLTGRRAFEYYLEWGVQPNATTALYQIAFGTDVAARLLVGVFFGALAAYSVGQLFSMAIRSEILAAFLSLLLTFILAAWVWTVCLWQLSATIFLLPLFLGMMLATWLRTPDWIAGRNSWRGWWKPALAVLIPLLFIGVALPEARLSQIRYQPRTSFDWSLAPSNHNRDCTERLAEFRAGNNAEATKTADMYLQVAANLYDRHDPDLLERWRKPEYLDPAAQPPGSQIMGWKIPVDQRAVFKKAQQQQRELTEQAYATAISEAVEISQRPTCRFRFDPNYIAPPAVEASRRQPINLTKDRTRDQINSLIRTIAGMTVFKFDQPVPRFLAALHMGIHIRSGQPSPIVAYQLRDEITILQQIANWALMPGRTKEELHELLDTLAPRLQSPESPAESLLADHANILDVIEGQQTPIILRTNPVEPHASLAYLANQLGWERKRAAKALDHITRTNVRHVDRLIENLSDTTPRAIGIGAIRSWFRPEFGGLPEWWEIVDPQAMTSYLTSLEYESRVAVSELNRAYCDNVTCRHATLLRIALALYRLEYDEYPQNLDALVPHYLGQLPIDPYGCQPFQYDPVGLDRQLQCWTGDGLQHLIEAKTPILWSIGPGNVRLTKISYTERSDNTPVAPGEELPPRSRHSVYQFVGDTDPGWDGRNFTFPLQN